MNLIKALIILSPYHWPFLAKVIIAGIFCFILLLVVATFRFQKNEKSALSPKQEYCFMEFETIIAICSLSCFFLSAFIWMFTNTKHDLAFGQFLQNVHSYSHPAGSLFIAEKVYFGGQIAGSSGKACFYYVAQLRKSNLDGETLKQEYQALKAQLSNSRFASRLEYPEVELLSNGHTQYFEKLQAPLWNKATQGDTQNFYIVESQAISSNQGDWRCL